jgi:predicted CoA-binding protein
MNVAILGASNNPSRYSYLAFKKLLAHGHRPFPVSPKLKELEGVPVVAGLGELREPIDTITMYVGPDKSSQMEREILALKPRRVIFNPGSENPKLASALREAGAEVENACTLVLLASGQF